MSRRRPASPAPADARFWGRLDELPANQPPNQRSNQPADQPAKHASNKSNPPRIAQRIRPTPDPGAVARSLGNPPLAVGATTSRRHLDAVYEEAVRAATALAAANGLLDDSDS